MTESHAGWLFKNGRVYVSVADGYHQQRVEVIGIDPVRFMNYQIEYNKFSAQPLPVVVPETLQEFFDVIKAYYAGRMYLSKNELIALGQAYKLEPAGLTPLVSQEIADLYAETKTYYAGRMYLSKKELVALGVKHGLDITGLA